MPGLNFHDESEFDSRIAEFLAMRQAVLTD